MFIIRLRQNVYDFLNDCYIKYIEKDKKISLLDIAPQKQDSSNCFYNKEYIQVDTLDIDKDANPTYVCDITKDNSEKIKDNSYDIIICTEVLEHTLQPFDAVNEIYRMLKHNGKLFCSIPCNLRIHGPLPDCWRITEYGIKSLFNKFRIISLDALEYLDRELFPVQYTIVLQKI